MNKELLKQVRDAILQNETRFDMCDFIDWPSSDLSDEELIKDCKTTFCIAGWAVKLTQEKLDLLDFGHIGGRRALDLTDDEANKLFYHGSWPNEYYDRYYHALMVGAHSEQVKITIELIDEILEKGIWW